jgi:hypothetical protein
MVFTSERLGYLLSPRYLIVLGLSLLIFLIFQRLNAQFILNTHPAFRL